MPAYVFHNDHYKYSPRLRCTCAWCVQRKPHPTTAAHRNWVQRERLMVSESLELSDLRPYRVCELCCHEEWVS
jgi:hypothetical protein